MPDADQISQLDKTENSWEDVTNASLSYLLKNALGSKAPGAGGGKSAVSMQTSSQIKTLQDTEKLKQNITHVCDKISKGAKIEF